MNKKDKQRIKNRFRARIRKEKNKSEVTDPFKFSSSDDNAECENIQVAKKKKSLHQENQGINSSDDHEIYQIPETFNDADYASERDYFESSSSDEYASQSDLYSCFSEDDLDSSVSEKEYSSTKQSTAEFDINALKSWAIFNNMWTVYCWCNK